MRTRMGWSRAASSSASVEPPCRYSTTGTSSSFRNPPKVPKLQVVTVAPRPDSKVDRSESKFCRGVGLSQHLARSSR